mmetsp:Transcript_5793/g.19197  ORF Transcript_5793/g.19197 Transcript_5793/m.19197 type:complete len:203 (+) Transcript_5793:249-857(+)
MAAHRARSPPDRRPVICRPLPCWPLRSSDGTPPALEHLLHQHRAAAHRAAGGHLLGQRLPGAAVGGDELPRLGVRPAHAHLVLLPRPTPLLHVHTQRRLAPARRLQKLEREPGPRRGHAAVDGLLGGHRRHEPNEQPVDEARLRTERLRKLFGRGGQEIERPDSCGYECARGKAEQVASQEGRGLERTLAGQVAVEQPDEPT